MQREEPVLGSSGLRHSGPVHRMGADLKSVAAGNHREHPANLSCVADHCRIHGHMVKGAPLVKFLNRNGPDAAIHTRVPVHVADVGYVYDVDVGDNRPAAETVSPPGMQGLERRQRHPADIAEAKAHAETGSGAESEKSDQGRRPRRNYGHRSRPPAPTKTRPPEPPAVVEGRPTPRIIIHPGPTITIDPAPPAVTVGRPGRRNPRIPHGSVAGYLGPGAIRIQIFYSVYSRVHILIAGRAGQLCIPPLIPAVPLIGVGSWHVPYFDVVIRVVCADKQSVAAFDSLGTLA